MQPIISKSKHYLRERQILKLLPISRSTLWRWVRSGQFPKPIKISQGVTVWSQENVDAFMNGGKNA
jgi:predicted DNA-binding transcriptional regulator AlpA